MTESEMKALEEKLLSLRGRYIVVINHNGASREWRGKGGYVIKDAFSGKNLAWSCCLKKIKSLVEVLYCIPDGYEDTRMEELKKRSGQLSWL